MKKFLAIILLELFLTITLFSVFTSPTLALELKIDQACLDKWPPGKTGYQECLYRAAYNAADLKYCQNLNEADTRRCQRAVNKAISDKQEKERQLENYGQELLDCIESKQFDCLPEKIKTAKNPDLSLCQLYDYVYLDLRVECVNLVSDYLNISPQSACKDFFNTNKQLSQCIYESKCSDIECCDVFPAEPDKDGIFWKDSCLSNVALNSKDIGICEYRSTNEKRASCRGNIRQSTNINDYKANIALGFILLGTLWFYVKKAKKNPAYKKLVYFITLYLLLSHISLNLGFPSTTMNTLSPSAFLRPLDFYIEVLEGGWIPWNWAILFLGDITVIGVTLMIFKLTKFKTTPNKAANHAIIGTILVIFAVVVFKLYSEFMLLAGLG